MSHVSHDREKLLARIRRIKGQVAALEKVLEAGEPECKSVLQQIAAIRGATNGLMAEVLEGHVREHLGFAESTATERAADVEIVLSALRSYLK